MTDEPQHNITKWEIEMIHRDKDGKIKEEYHEEVDLGNNL